MISDAVLKVSLSLFYDATVTTDLDWLEVLVSKSFLKAVGG